MCGDQKQTELIALTVVQWPFTAQGWKTSIRSLSLHEIERLKNRFQRFAKIFKLTCTVNSPRLKERGFDHLDPVFPNTRSSGLWHKRGAPLRLQPPPCSQRGSRAATGASPPPARSRRPALPGARSRDGSPEVGERSRCAAPPRPLQAFPRAPRRRCQTKVPREKGPQAGRGAKSISRRAGEKGCAPTVPLSDFQPGSPR